MHIAHRGMIWFTPRWAFVSLRSVYIVFGCICWVSSALAIAQSAFGWYPFPIWVPGQAPGLFYNTAAAGYAYAIVGVALFTRSLWWMILPILPGLWLANSRGGWAALTLGIIATRFRHPLWLLVGILALGFIYTLHPNPSDFQRLEIWKAAWLNLTFWGNGLGSFMALYMGDPTCCLVKPEYAHNDYLQTVFEFGIWSVIPFAVVFWAVSRTQTADWPVLITFMFIACFSMPLHMPIPLTLGTVALISIFLEAFHA